MEKVPRDSEPADGQEDAGGIEYDFDSSPERLMADAAAEIQRNNDEMLRRSDPETYNAIAQAYEGYVDPVEPKPELPQRGTDPDSGGTGQQ
jgi:hypothetical protein